MPQIRPITDLRNTNEISNLCHAGREPIFITKNGKIVAKLTNPFQDRVDLVESLVGVLKNDISLEEAREERLSKL